MESAQARVQSAVTDLVTALDKNHIRKMQRKMYECSTACCSDDYRSMEEVQTCLDRCSEPVGKAQNYFQQELSSFQERLQRCAVSCSDKVRDKLPANATEADVQKHKPELEACVVRCADEHIAILPSMMNRMKEVLQQYS